MAKSAKGKPGESAKSTAPRTRATTTAKSRSSLQAHDAADGSELRRKSDRRTPLRVAPEAIACRAYDLYVARGGEHGRDIDDWLQAELDLREMVGDIVA